MSFPKISIHDQIVSRRFRRLTIFGVAGFLLLGISMLSALIGSVHLSVGTVLQSIQAGLTAERPSTLSPGQFSIIWDIRLPRILMGLASGMGLAMGGAAMQGVTRNPLVSPYTLGLSSAAAFGASVAIVLNRPDFIIQAAFFTSMLSISMVLFFSRRQQIQSETLILAGIAIMFAFSAGTSLLQYLASQDQLSRIIFWLMGSMSAVSWRQAWLVSALVVIAAPVLQSLSWKLNILSTGEMSAAGMGVNPLLVRLTVVLTVTIITAVIVSFCGVIGFIGLAAPHIARLLIGSDHRILLPFAGLCGGGLLLISDTISRILLSHTEIPIGIITSFLGVPFLIAILVNRQKTRGLG